MESVQFAFGAGQWWLYALIACGCVGGAVWMYRKVDPYPGPTTHKILVGLRSVSLMLLILALFEPLLRFTQSSVSKPRVAIVIDDSKSNGINDRLGSRKDAVVQTIRKLTDNIGSEYDVYVVRDRASRASDTWSLDSLSFTSPRTNLGSAIRLASNTADDRQYGAMIVVSDGQSNTGENPIYPAENSGLGLYSIGIGDSVPPTDARITSIIAPPVAYIGKPSLITTEFESYGLPDVQTDVTLFDNGVEVGKQTLSIRKGVPHQSLSFTYTPTADGNRKLTVTMAGIAGEKSTLNNTNATYMKVMKDARSIVLFAGAPSPDVSFIRGALESDPTVSLKTFIQKQGAEYYEGVPNAATFDNVKACILVGFPISSTSDATLKLVADAAEKGMSILFVASQQTDYRKLGALKSVIPFTVTNSRPQEFQVTPDVPRTAVSDPIMTLTGSEDDAGLWKDMPPIYRTETFVRPAPGAVVLSMMKNNFVQMQEPLIIKSETNNARVVAILGYGLYRWKLLRDGPAQTRSTAGTANVDVLGTFLGNTVRWLSVREDQDRIRIKPTQTLYVAGEEIVMTGSVLDQRYNGIDKAEITVTISGTNLKKDVVLAGEGSGQYRTSVGVLPSGDYSYTGKVMVRGEQLGIRSGRFSVGDISIEESATWMNAPLLHALADRTGGTFATVGTVDSLLQKLSSDPRMQPVVRSRDTELALWYSPWLLGAALVCFALEWILRKRSSLI